MAEHKRKNKVSSLLSSAVNEALVSALNKIEIKHVNESLSEVLTGFVFSVIKRPSFSPVQVSFNTSRNKHNIFLV